MAIPLAPERNHLPDSLRDGHGHGDLSFAGVAKRSRSSNLDDALGGYYQSAHSESGHNHRLFSRSPLPLTLASLILEKPMRKLLGLMVVLAISTVVVSEDKKPSLDGTYVIVAIEKNGEKLPDESLRKTPEEDRTFTIKGDKLIRMGKNKEPIELKIDASKTPAEIDMKETKGDKPELSYGIYKLEGDTLTICGVEDSKPEDRPKEFKTSKDSKALLLIMKKKDK